MGGHVDPRLVKIERQLHNQTWRWTGGTFGSFVEREVMSRFPGTPESLKDSVALAIRGTWDSVAQALDAYQARAVRAKKTLRRIRTRIRNRLVESSPGCSSESTRSRVSAWRRSRGKLATMPSAFWRVGEVTRTHGKRSLPCRGRQRSPLRTGFLVGSLSLQKMPLKKLKAARSLLRFRQTPGRRRISRLPADRLQKRSPRPASRAIGISRAPVG